MRGDDAISTDERLHLVWADNLRGLPVFSPAAEKLGVLESVAIHEARGSIAYGILRSTTLMGLRKTRRLLRQDELIVDAERGGFALTGRAFEAGDIASITVARAPCRLDPARSV